MKYLVLFFGMLFMTSCATMNSATVNQDVTNNGNEIYYKGEKIAEVNNVSYIYYEGKRTLGIDVILESYGLDQNTDLVVDFLSYKYPDAKVEVNYQK